MCGTKIVLAFGVLLAVAYARPGGYGVKGVKSFRATANAAASGQAFENTGSGYSGVARSSASASANASAGGTASAAAEATANAFADGENIEKAISSASAIANANHPIGRSDVPDRPSNREEDIEYKATNHQDGTPSCDQHIANAGHGGFVNNENSTPGSIDSTNSATVCHPGDSKCRNSKNDDNVPSSHPTYKESPPDLSSVSSEPLPDRVRDWGGNAASPGSEPCTAGSHTCLESGLDGSNSNQHPHNHPKLPAVFEKSGNKKNVPNPHLSHNVDPHFSDDSSQSSADGNDDWEGSTDDPGSRPCAYGSPKCSTSYIPNPDQTYPGHAELPGDSGKPPHESHLLNKQFKEERYPDISAGSAQAPPNTNNDWGGNNRQSVPRPCAYDNPKCASGRESDVSIPDQSHHKHDELPAGSGRPVNEQSVSNPQPSYNEQPDLSAGSSQPLPKPDGSWGGNNANPGALPCISGSRKCSGGQPYAPNPIQPHEKHVESSTGSDSSYNKHPNLSTGSSQTLPEPDGAWRGNTDNPGSRPCISGNRECLGDQQLVPNPNQRHDKHVALPTDSGKPITKPSVSNSHPSSNRYPNLSAGSSQPLPNVDGGYGGHKSIKPAEERDDVKGGHRRIPLNKNSDVSIGSSHPLPTFSDGCGGNSATPGSRRCTFGSSGSKPGISNPFLNGEIDVSEIQKAVKSGGSSPDGKPNPSNPFLNDHNQHPATPTGGIHHSDNSNNSDSGRPPNQNPESKPNPLNPFLNNHNQHLPTPTGSTDHSGNPNSSNQGRPSYPNPESKPNPSNPFLNNHSQHPPTPTGSTHHSGNPNDSNVGRPSDQNPESKPNPSNPFLNSHSQHPPTPTGSTHHSGNPNDSNVGRPSNQNPESKPNPSNPFLNSHSQHPPTPTGSTHDSGNSNNSVHERPSDQYPGSESNPSNSFLNPHNQHPSSSTANTHNLENHNGSDEAAGPSNRYPHGQQSPSKPLPSDHERDEVEACSRRPCKHNGPNARADNENLDADGIGNRKTPGTPSDGVKTYQPGVKGNSARRPQSSPPIKYHATGDRDEASANANASWGAYSNAHASASADGDGGAHAKSQAYSSADASGWSNSWASSSASASASASSSSWH